MGAMLTPCRMIEGKCLQMIFICKTGVRDARLDPKAKTPGWQNIPLSLVGYFGSGGFPERHGEGWEISAQESPLSNQEETMRWTTTGTVQNP
jgi:hypothetical protein